METIIEKLALALTKVVTGLGFFLQMRHLTLDNFV